MTQKDYINFIKKKREDNLILQKDIAKQIPIAKSTYSKIENHQQNPSFFVIKRLAEIFDFDLNLIKDKEKDFVDID